MSIDTLEDFSWVTFEETDEPEVCIFQSCSNEAVGALYIPVCGRHPFCLPHLRQQRANFRLTIKGADTLTITCHIHNTNKTYHCNPAVFVG